MTDPTPEEKLRAAVLEYDKQVAACPANRNWLGDKACPKCGADSGQSCGLIGSAEYAVVQAAKALETPPTAIGAGIPADIAELLAEIGEAEWGATDALDAQGHADHVAKSVRLTAEHFGQDEPQPMHGLYAKGTETVICHTGTSPNSPNVARVLTTAWNRLVADSATPPTAEEPTAEGGKEEAIVAEVMAYCEINHRDALELAGIIVRKLLPQAPPSTASLDVEAREAIARIIEPNAWIDGDTAARAGVPESWRIKNTKRFSLDRADAILALTASGGTGCQLGRVS